MPFLPPGKKFAGDTHYKDEFSKRKTRVYQQAGLRPTSAFRRNNPHPNGDFLMPKNLVEKDKEQVLRGKVTEAVHQYMDKMIRSGRDPLKPMDQPQRSRSPTHSGVYSRAPKVDLLEGFVKPSVALLDKVKKQDRKQMKRERGNSYKKAAKSYGDVPDVDDDFIVRIPANVYNQSRTVRYRVVHQPDAPADQWVSHKGNVPGPSGVKRAHTPPTPPINGPHRSRSASLHQQKHLRSKSAPLLDKTAITEEGGDEASDWEDVDGGNEAEKPVSALLQRPKTAGPVLARKMMVHPRMKNWIEGATDYEKEVAFNLLKTLNGGEQPLLPEDSQTASRPKQKSTKASRIPHATHMYVPPSPAPRKPVPERAGKMDATTKEWMRKVEQKINERSETPVERKYTQKIELRPTVRRQPRPKSLGDYTHENSFFRFSQPSFRRSFVIAPDWVSETLTRRRALKENSSTNQMRYGSA